MKYVLSKQCSFNRNKDSLIGYTNLCFRNGVWIPQYHLNVDDSLNSGYEEKMQSFCKYIKDVIVPNGYVTDSVNIQKLQYSTFQKKGGHCMTWLSRMHVSPAFISCRVVDRLQCTTQTIRHEVVYCQMLITHRLHLIRNKHEVKSRYLLEPFLRISLW